MPRIILLEYDWLVQYNQFMQGVFMVLRYHLYLTNPILWFIYLCILVPMYIIFMFCANAILKTHARYLTLAPKPTPPSDFFQSEVNVDRRIGERNFWFQQRSTQCSNFLQDYLIKSSHSIRTWNTHYKYHHWTFWNMCMLYVNHNYLYTQPKQF